MKCLEATDSNGTELYLFQLEGNLFISVPKEQLKFKPLSLEELKGLEKDCWTNNGVPEACRSCSNHPSNGGTGICHCTIGSPSVTCNSIDCQGK